MSNNAAKEYEAFMKLADGRCRDEQEKALIREAYNVASEAHKGVRLHSGKPYIIRPLEVASIVVADIGLGCKSMCAALLFDVVENTDYTIEDVAHQFGDKIAALVEGLVNINNILDSDDTEGHPDSDSESVQAENFKRILLSMGNDVRVVLIKLADLLQRCRNLSSIPEERREKMLSETMSIFIPLAHRLGLYSIKSELENIWLRYSRPKEYQEIERRIDKDLDIRTRELDEFIAPIAATLKADGVSFTIKKRIKTPYSIWYKMRNKKVPFEQIYDLYAVRIIFDPGTENRKDERDMAFQVMSAVSQFYPSKTNRMRNWIDQPKNNGYEALHMTVMSNAGIWVEVQIRSRRMDDIAEKGIAAHWNYKNDGYLSESDSKMDLWLAKVQEILSSDSIDSLELLDIIQDDIVTNEIVVFTPKGEQRSIAKGATALDFAYKVHTNVGNQAIAAKVNMKLAPLSRVLMAGDQVEIITAKNAHPKPEWVRFLHTRSAKRKLLDWLRANAPEDLPRAEGILHPKGPAAPAPSIIPVRIVLRGYNRAGLADEIENALKRIDGIEDVVVSDV